MLQTRSHTALHTSTVSPPALDPMMKNIWHGEGLTIHSTDAGTAGLFISVTVISAAVISPTITGPLHSATVARRIYEAVAAILADKRAVLVHERVFASESCAKDLITARRLALSSNGIHPDTPLSIIQGRPTWGEGIAGVFFHAIPADIAPVETLTVDAIPVGRYWSTAAADYLVLQLSGATKQASGVSAEVHHVPVSQIPSHHAQADGLFDVAAELLNKRGFSFSDVARTWFYIRDLLQHYRTFNQVRDSKYARYGLMPKPPAPIWLPASTAIGGAPTNGAALVADIFAVKSRNNIPARRLSNPGQKEAFDYGASFARATLIQEQDVDLIQVSGTASIGEDGKTRHIGDGAAQIACTLDKLEALLDTASAQLDHVVTANIFVKDPALIEVFKKIAKERGLSDFPGVAVVADVCRDDLLFEIDAEVIVPRNPSTKTPAVAAGGNAP